MKTNEIDPSLPSNKFLKATSKLSCNYTSLLLQLRTCHIPLNKHLHCISKANSPFCPHCPSRHETVHHFLLMCPAYTPHRRELEKHLGRGAKSLQHLLLNPKTMSCLVSFIRSTERLRDFFMK
ncbi:hypothetical protein K439DRAFT_1325962 [Ramaria rubella]|nr:hypothetical protein K439DRAFT_1325962 [Ramaria rubella]